MPFAILGVILAMLVNAPVYPIHVMTCDPRRYESPGYDAGYYPGTPYYWRDVYGYRYLQPPPVNTATLGIDYVNRFSTTAKVIEFGLVARGVLVAEVRDVGTFSTGAEIRHQFGLDPHVFPLGTALPRCVALYVRFADGTRSLYPH